MKVKGFISLLFAILLLFSCLALFGCDENEAPEVKNGTMWHTGDGVPSADTGVLGDLYLMTSNSSIWKKTEGGWEQISTLTPAPSEDSRASWYSGQGAPSPMDTESSKDGDLYLDMLSREIYIKEEGEWLLYGNFSTDALPQKWDDDGVLKILCIGNSFSDDSMEYVYQVADSLGVESMKLGNLYIGGCTLSTHLSNAKSDKGAYAYRTNTSGSWSTQNNYKISDAVKSENWDFISFQQASGYSGIAESYGDLSELISIVKPLCPNATLVWHMTWAYQSTSTHSDFPKYSSNQMTMYNAILNAVNTKIDTLDDIEIVIPVGTAIQNTRTSYVGDNVTRDGYHLNNYGRYIGALTFIKALIGYDIEDVSFAPAGVTTGQINVAIESVSNAVASPYEVTDSQITGEPQISIDGLTELELTFTKGAYYNSDINKQLHADSSNSSQFFATELFTKEQLPVGSVIEIAQGWQCRPECWQGTTNGGSRPGNFTATRIEVTETWWADYTERAFNISKVGNPSLSSYTEEQIAQIFKIYIPQQ